MALRRLIGVTLFIGMTAFGAAAGIAACGNGNDGANGVPGPAGTPGPAGPAGPTGAAAGADGGPAPLAGACTTPCHTFNGVVDQWRFSNHSHPQNTEIGGGACGNCHGIDGLQQRLAGNYIAPADAGAVTEVPRGHISFRSGSGVAEISYGGATTIGRIHCSTCHDFNASNDPHVVGKYDSGQAPLRVPGGVNDTAFVEASPADAGEPVGQSVAYRAANTCIFCHKSRKDVKFYIGANNVLSSTRWGPHEGPQSDVYSGKGGYHFEGAKYTNGTHTTLANGCVSCHMQPVAANGNVPDHSMKPQLTICKTCHAGYSGQTFDVESGQTNVRKALRELQTALNDANMLTRGTSPPYGPLTAEQLADDQFQLDAVRPGGNGGANINASAPRAGALYNYLILARSKDFGLHNPRYAKQLLFDSIKEIKGANPTSISRPE